MNQAHKKQHMQIIITNNFSNYITSDRTNKFNLKMCNSLSVNQTRPVLLISEDAFSSLKCLHKFKYPIPLRRNA